MVRATASRTHARTCKPSLVGIACGSKSLRLRQARRFYDRLAGLHVIERLKPDEGLWITPCKAVHTFGLQYAIDVVFLSDRHRIVRVVDSLAPYRITVQVNAASVIELPAGYCKFHPDHAERISAALGAFSS